MALSIVANRPDPAIIGLPWSTPLEEWSGEFVVPFPRGLSRHVVRIIRLGDRVYAVKETTEEIAMREYRMLRDLQRLGLPAVAAQGVVSGRTDAAGEPLPAGSVRTGRKGLTRKIPAGNGRNGPAMRPKHPHAAESGVGEHTARESERAQQCAIGKECVASTHPQIWPRSRKAPGPYCFQKRRTKRDSGFEPNVQHSTFNVRKADGLV